MAFTINIRRWLRIGSFVAALFVGLLVVAIVSTQTVWFKDWLRRYVMREADGYLNGTLAIQRLDGNLFTGLEIEGVTLTQGRQTIFAAKDVGLRYSLWDLIGGGVVIDEIRLNEPRVALSRGPNGWNVAGLVKEQAQEADREGPAKPITISRIGITNGTVTIDEPAGPDALGLPKRIERLDLQGSFAYQPVDFVIDLGQVSFRASEPALALNSLAGRIVVNQDDVTLDKLVIHTAESALSARGTVRSYLKTPTLNVSVSSEKLTPREFAGFAPALADVRLQPAIDLTARGPLEALETVLAIRSDAGTLNATVVADAMGPERGLRGKATLGELDLSRVVDGLPASRVNATTDVDLVLDAGNDIDGRAAVHVTPTTVDGYRVDALDATATIVDSRLRLDAAARAYGARATAKGDVVVPINGRQASGELTGHIASLDLRKLPRQLGVPALATRAGGTYRAKLDDRGPSGELVFDASTVEGASIDAGTRVSGTLYGSRPTFTAKGGVRGVDPHRFGTVLRLPALTEDRLRGRLDATFDVAGSGKTLATLDLQGRVGLPRAAIVGGTVTDAVADVRLTRGALDGTLTGSFTNLDPGLAANRPPLAGAVSGAIDLAMATPSVTAFSVPDTTGRVQLTLQPSRVGDHTVDCGALQATLADGVLDVASLDVVGPLADVTAQGKVAVTREGASTLQYRVVVADLAPAAALAGQADVHGAGHVEGTVTGNLAELHTTGTLSLSNAAYGTTARAVDTQARFDVTLPDLDVQRIRVEAQTRAALVEAAGQSLREVTADVRYADRAATFATTVAASDARTLDAAGTLALPQPAGVDVRLDCLTATAEGASWSLTAPARIVYADDRVDVDRLALASGAQHIEAAGAVAVGEHAARAVPADRPLRLTLTNVDLAEVDRLARTGRGLGGILNGTATASGDLQAPDATAHLTVRDGKVGDFTYQSLDATIGHDAKAAKVEARLERGAEWLTVRGTLPPAPVLRDDARRNTAPVDLHVESSAIDLGRRAGVHAAHRGGDGHAERQRPPHRHVGRPRRRRWRARRQRRLPPHRRGDAVHQHPGGPGAAGRSRRRPHAADRRPRRPPAPSDRPGRRLARRAPGRRRRPAHHQRRLPRPGRQLRAAAPRHQRHRRRDTAGPARQRHDHGRLGPHRSGSRPRGAASGQAGGHGRRRGRCSVAGSVEPGALGRGRHRLPAAAGGRGGPAAGLTRCAPGRAGHTRCALDRRRDGGRPAGQGPQHAHSPRRWCEGRWGRVVARQPEHDPGRRPARDQGGRCLHDGRRHRQHGAGLLRVPGTALRAAARRHGELQGAGSDQPAAQRHRDA